MSLRVEEQEITRLANECFTNKDFTNKDFSNYFLSNTPIVKCSEPYGELKSVLEEETIGLSYPTHVSQIKVGVKSTAEKVKSNGTSIIESLVMGVKQRMNMLCVPIIPNSKNSYTDYGVGTKTLAIPKDLYIEENQYADFLYGVTKLNGKGKVFDTAILNSYTLEKLLAGGDDINNLEATTGLGIRVVDETYNIRYDDSIKSVKILEDNVVIMSSTFDDNNGSVSDFGVVSSENGNYLECYCTFDASGTFLVWAKLKGFPRLYEASRYACLRFTD